jgi:phosphoribosylformimino-5-aminoimidazole carboxamide ribotide isomerase
MVEEACRQFPERVILGIDARGGRVAIQGWNQVVSLEAVDLAKQFEERGLSAIIFTDIERDGMSTGLNFESTRRLSESTSIPVIASGGVSRIEDIEHLLELKSERIVGVIIGRALYTGQIDLEEAIRITKFPLGSTRSQAPNSK